MLEDRFAEPLQRRTDYEEGDTPAERIEAALTWFTRSAEKPGRTKMTTTIGERPRPERSPNSRFPRAGRDKNPGPATQPGKPRNDPPPSRPGKDNTPDPRPLQKPGR